jgi:hypothetical protein
MVARPTSYTSIGSRTPPPPKARPGSAAKEQPLIHIVMQDKAEMLLIKTTEIFAEISRQNITDGIRMSQTFTFDHFHRLHANRSSAQRLYLEMHFPSVEKLRPATGRMDACDIHIIEGFNVDRYPSARP